MDRITNIYLFIALLYLTPTHSFAQENARFETELGEVFLELNGMQRSELYNSSDSVLNQWRAIGNIAASLDSVSLNELGSTFHFYKGKKLVWDEIKIDRTPELVQSLGVPLSKKSQFTYKDIRQYFEKILVQAENAGYPFARVSLKNIRNIKGELISDLYVDLGTLFTYDSLIVKGDARINYKFLLNVLNIKKGEPYNEEQLNGLSRKLSQIPYIKSRDKPQFVFKKGKVDTYLSLENKKANRFSGIIGFLPNSVTGKTNFTGDIDLSLMNTMKLGEKLSFEWQRIRPEVLELNGAVDLPFLLNSPFGIHASLNIFRQDSSILEVKSETGVFYNFASEDHLKVYYSSYNSDRLESGQGSDLGGSDQRSYGIGVSFNDLDYTFNPRKGYRFSFSGDAGTRTFRSPAQTDSSLIEIPENSDVFQLRSSAELYVPSGKRSVFLFALHGASKINQYLLDNELLRIGGNNTLRGFDEESLRLSSYIYMNMEYRLITDLNSNVFLFTNFAWVEKNTFLSYSNDLPFGFGAGANFDTKAGIFSLTYALGAEQNSPIMLNRSKVHFGFKSLF